VRAALCNTLVGYAADPRFVFLTGDLGYNALEPLRDAMGPRFINAGVAEQNMVAVAAGLGMIGFRPWAYSIAPFLYGRPFEQIRNDVCLHDLPVMLAGNGGGYAYGVMGSTHHALEDYGVLLTLPNLRVFVPAFAVDVPAVISTLRASPHPAYLRLGKCEKPADFTAPTYAGWRRLTSGDGPTMVVVGPLVGGLLDAIRRLAVARRPGLWVASELPFVIEAIPADFLACLRRSGHLIVVEEHVAHGGAGEMLARCLLSAGEAPPTFTHLHAAGYPSGRYGSQEFHRRESGLDAASVIALLDR
jgi:transketolase